MHAFMHPSDFKYFSELIRILVTLLILNIN